MPRTIAHSLARIAAALGNHGLAVALIGHYRRMRLPI
jgi:hypothetical protein